MNDSSNKESEVATKNGMLQTVKQQKIIPLNSIVLNFIKSEKESIKSSLCDYSDPFDLVSN